METTLMAAFTEDKQPERITVVMHGSSGGCVFPELTQFYTSNMQMSLLEMLTNVVSFTLGRGTLDLRLLGGSTWHYDENGYSVVMYHMGN